MVDITRGSDADTKTAPPAVVPAGSVRIPAPPVPRSPARARRRPAMVGAGIALLALGGLTSAWLVSSTGDTMSVLALAEDVQRGEVIDRADLTVVDIRPDPALTVVPETRLDVVVGTNAATGLLAGSLLTPGSTTDQLVPDEGLSLVGVALTTGQMPAELLAPGDPVRIVDTPPAQADPPAQDPDAINGEVMSVAGPDDVGLTTVDVLVPADEAAGLAARVATGRVALILDSRES